MNTKIIPPETTSTGRDRAGRRPGQHRRLFSGPKRISTVRIDALDQRGAGDGGRAQGRRQMRARERREMPAPAGTRWCLPAPPIAGTWARTVCIPLSSWEAATWISRPSSNASDARRIRGDAPRKRRRRRRAGRHELWIGGAGSAQNVYSAIGSSRYARPVVRDRCSGPNAAWVARSNPAHVSALKKGNLITGEVSITATQPLAVSFGATYNTVNGLELTPWHPERRPCWRWRATKRLRV